MAFSDSICVDKHWFKKYNSKEMEQLYSEYLHKHNVQNTSHNIFSPLKDFVVWLIKVRFVSYEEIGKLLFYASENFKNKQEITRLENLEFNENILIHFGDLTVENTTILNHFECIFVTGKLTFLDALFINDAYVNCGVLEVKNNLLISNHCCVMTREKTNNWDMTVISKIGISLTDLAMITGSISTEFLSMSGNTICTGKYHKVSKINLSQSSNLNCTDYVESSSIQMNGDSRILGNLKGNLELVMSDDSYIRGDVESEQTVLNDSAFIMGKPTIKNLIIDGESKLYIEQS